MDILGLNSPVNSRILRLIAEIDEFKGFWRGMDRLAQETLSTLRILATIESIGSSTRIEGARLTDRQVAALLEGIDTRSFRSRDEQEVAGYADAMQLIHDSYEEIELTENNIKYMHRTLMGHSTKDHWHMGAYKKYPNHIAAFDQDGKEIGIIFETSSPFETPAKMKELVESTQRRFREESEHPLLTISDFVVFFLAIHPFQDGNGRLSRILTNLLLLRAGYDHVQYSSHERIVEANKERYYLVLRNAQKALMDSTDPDFTWTEFFLDMMKKQKDELFEKIKREQVAFAVPRLSQDILNITREHGRVTVSFLTKVLSANRNTIKKHIQQLALSGKLVLHGKGRGAFYTLP